MPDIDYEDLQDLHADETSDPDNPFEYTLTKDQYYEKLSNDEAVRVQGKSAAEIAEIKELNVACHDIAIARLISNHLTEYEDLLHAERKDMGIASYVDNGWQDLLESFS